MAVRLHVLGSFDPTEVTRLVGVSPMEVGLAGTVIPPRRIAEKEDSWTVGTVFAGVEVELEQHIEALRPALQKLNEVRHARGLSDLRIVLVAHVYMYGGVTPCLWLPGKLMAALVGKGHDALDIDLDALDEVPPSPAPESNPANGA
jgi:hypothetical protein